MGSYFDSSAAVKRYAPEIGSGWVNTICESAEDKVYLGQIGVVEIAAALSKKVRTKELTQEDCEATLEVFLEDVRNSEYLIVPLTDQAVELGVDLTRRYFRIIYALRSMNPNWKNSRRNVMKVILANRP